MLKAKGSQKLISIVLSILITVTLISCAPAAQNVSPTNPPAQAPATQKTTVDKIIVGYWGGVWGDAYKEAAIDPFTKGTGIEVDLVPNAESNLALLAADTKKSSPLYDVIFVSDTEFYTAINSGLLAPVNYDNVSHASELYDFGKSKYGISSEIGSYGIAYNEEMVKPAPTSWADLLKPEYAKLVAFITPSTDGPQIHNLGIFAIAAGGTYTDAGTTGIEVAKKLVKNGAKFGPFGTIASLYTNKEIGIAPFTSQEPIHYQQDGLPIQFILPKEGGFAVGSFMVMPLNIPAERKAAAEKFMDYVVSPDAQKVIAEKIFSGPVNKTAVLDDKLAAIVHPYGQKEIDSLIMTDWNFILQNADNWITTFNKEVKP
jgi:putative spermidine/putrescine transport system substrate-binding protein